MWIFQSSAKPLKTVLKKENANHRRSLVRVSIISVFLLGSEMIPGQNWERGTEDFQSQSLKIVRSTSSTARKISANVKIQKMSTMESGAFVLRRNKLFVPMKPEDNAATIIICLYLLMTRDRFQRVQQIAVLWTMRFPLSGQETHSLKPVYILCVILSWIGQCWSLIIILSDTMLVRNCSFLSDTCLFLIVVLSDTMFVFNCSFIGYISEFCND